MLVYGTWGLDGLVSPTLGRRRSCPRRDNALMTVWQHRRARRGALIRRVSSPTGSCRRRPSGYTPEPLIIRTSKKTRSRRAAPRFLATGYEEAAGHQATGRTIGSPPLTPGTLLGNLLPPLISLAGCAQPVSPSGRGREGHVPTAAPPQDTAIINIGICRCSYGRSRALRGGGSLWLGRGRSCASGISVRHPSRAMSSRSGGCGGSGGSGGGGLTMGLEGWIKVSLLSRSPGNSAPSLCIGVRDGHRA